MLSNDSQARLHASSFHTEERKRRINPTGSVMRFETSVGTGRQHSRYSGRPDEHWQVSKKRANKTLVEKVTQASLAKRGLKRGQEEAVIKSGYGAYDPENIEVVNLKETSDMTFLAIADHLNKKRVADGRNPTLTFTGVNGRYNRTAPVIFESQGKVFIPLSQRRKDNLGANLHGTSKTPDELNNATWDEELDLKLVKIVRQYGNV